MVQAVDAVVDGYVVAKLVLGQYRFLGTTDAQPWVADVAQAGAFTDRPKADRVAWPLTAIVVSLGTARKLAARNTGGR